MSSIGNWAYVNDVITRPFIEYLDNGKARYGKPVTIKCYFTSKRENLVNADGLEFTSSMMFLTEYNGIKELDLIGGKVAKSVELLNSTPFGETVMDYRIWA